uniref:hypothetical protein n=1 Tax=Stenotrophomonas maltophilia TaxID=40324 RepID=UPI0013DC50DF
DLESWIRQKTAEDVQGRPTAYAGAYAQTMAPIFGRLRQEHAQYRAGRENQAVESGLVGIYQGAIGDGISQGKTPEQIVQD